MGKKATLFLLYGLSIILTIILALITIAALHIDSFSPTENTIFSFIGLIIPVLIVANICYAIYWIIRKKWLICIIPIVTIALCYSYFGTFYRFSDKINEITLQEKANPQNIRILTYNTHKFSSRNGIKNTENLVAFMESQNIDIACFQEYNTPSKFKDTIPFIFKMYPYSYTSDNVKERMFIATYSQYPIINSKYVEYPFSNYGYIESTIALCSSKTINKEINATMERYIAANSTININITKDSITSIITDSLINLSQKITVINTHLQSTGVSSTRNDVEHIKESGENIANIDAAQVMTTRMGISYKMRAQQINILTEAIDKSEYPVILCGDFNDTPLSYVYNKAANKLADGFKESGSGYMYTFRHFKKLLRIDYIFHSRNLKSIKYFSPDKDWSDHNPVISELEVP